MATFRHVGLTVSNKEDYCKLLVDTFGFKKVWDEVEKGEYINKFNGEIIDHVNTVKFKDSNSSMVELLCYEENNSINKIKSLRNQGITHLALSVTDMDNIIAQLDYYAWLRLVHDPLVVPSGTVKVCFVEDIKNGLFFELVEDLKTE
ncbi:VOC family protein [Schnuerera sp.]|uniref:VOC family protein n=1 Tax=Schnuerera sp. TaxID=2794844 RepID=UPI002C1E037D|nr:VOC family protein [Schnuerera sp.]HSH37124.1 VOC family protein [Schnuerera sp.]